MGSLIVCMGVACILVNFLNAALEAFDDLGWWYENNRDTGFVKSYIHLFRYNVTYTIKNDNLLGGIYIILLGFLVSLVSI